MNCRICGKAEFDPVLNMGRNPLVNSLISEADLDKKEPTYPLKLVRCAECSLVQVEKPIDANKIYKEVDYLYFSSDMPGLADYFKEYAEELKSRFLVPGELVVEIGSNDGVMLEHFVDQNLILGVDPATNVAIRALKRGVPTIPLFFEERLAKQIAAEWGQAKVIYGNNCIAHIDDIHSVMRGVKALLRDGGTFVVECNYWGGMVRNKNYALVYHDHFSYFSVKTWMTLAKKHGMEVFDAVVTPAQGGSLRIFLSKGVRLLTPRLTELMKEESSTGINTKEVAQKYGEDCKMEARKLHNLVTGLKKEGKTIYGYGAAAKGFSVLKLANIDESHITCFVDDSPAKQGKYTPTSHIPVVSRDSITATPDYFFITAPNYANVIIEKERDFVTAGGKFILCDASIV